MQRVTRATAVASLPAPPGSPGTPGYFTGGNPAGGVAATVPGYEWYNGVQEELIAVLAAAGITPSAANNAQLLASLNALFNAGRLLNVQVFTASGTYTPTPGMASVIFEVQGGGGGGGGAAGALSSNVSLGAPGTSGSYARGRFSAATVGASQAVTVGAGGSVTSGAAGSNGGASSVGSLITAPGGIGGPTLTNQAAPTVNGNGTNSSAPTGGNILAVQGSAASQTIALTQAIAFTGTGGASMFGPGAYSISINGAGVPAVNYGAGGGGSVVNSSGGSVTGGVGRAGIVIAYEYS